MRTQVLDINFDNLRMPEAVDYAMGLMKQSRGARAVTPNPEIVWECRSDIGLKHTINSSEIVLADGVGIILGAKILGTPICEKLAGIDFAMALMREMALERMSVYLFGAKPGVAEKAAGNLENALPGLVVSGYMHGYFDDEAIAADIIGRAKADLLLVCLGSPKQERFMAAYSEKLGAGLMIGLGGALDVWSGEVKRAPAVWRRLGLEWLHRLVFDPKRIRRMSRLPLFLFAVIMERLRGKNDAG